MVSYFLPKPFLEGDFSPKQKTALKITKQWDSESTSQKSISEAFAHLSQRSGRLKVEPLNEPPQSELKVGVLFSGGPAPGGHNVIGGLYDTLSRHTKSFQLIGFESGVKGILQNRQKVLTKEEVDLYRDCGGFHLLGSGRDKIEKREDLEKARALLEDFDVLVVIGGDDSNTNAAVMAQYFAHSSESSSRATRVIGVPKTIDGDLRSSKIETTFGHQSASQLYSSLVSALAVDAASARKYYHFIRLMGRSASHITLETALATQPSWTLIAEQVREKKMTLDQVVDELCAVIGKRLEKGMSWGTILIPEGIIEAIAQFQPFLEELNALSSQERAQLAQEKSGKSEILGTSILSTKSKKLFESLPKEFAASLLLEPDAHGNLQISKIESERLLADLVSKKLSHPQFAYQTHFFGYEARCIDPSPFDSYYCYLLGVQAAYLSLCEMNGVISCVGALQSDPERWIPQFECLVNLLTQEQRSGKKKYVIEKALVKVTSPAFQTLVKGLSKWSMQPIGKKVRPIQYLGEAQNDRESFFRDLRRLIKRPFDLPSL